MYGFDGFTVDVDRLEVRRGELVLALEPKAFRTLLYLIQNRERVVPKEELLVQVWAGAFVTDNALTRVIAQIRKQLGDNAREPRYIETLSTTGYRFVARVEEFAAETEHRPVSRMRWAIAAAVSLAVLGAMWILRRGAATPPRLTSLRQLTSSPAADLWPSFSPDGSQVVYSSNSSGDFQLYIRSLAPGGVDRQLTNDGLGSTQPAWSPDGKYIAYVSRLHGGIALLPVSGGVPRFLTDTGDTPRWSPDGRSLVYRILSLNMNPALETSGLADTVLMVVDAASGVTRPLTRAGHPPGGHTQASWLPDGRHVLFSTAAGDFAEDSRGKSSAGNSEFGAGNRAFGSKPWVIDTQSGGIEPLRIAANVVRSAVLSPDSRFLYFIGGEIDAGLWRSRLEGHWRASRPEVLIPASGAAPRDVALSADGSHIAVSQQFGADGIWQIPLDAAGAPAGPPKPLIQDRNIRHSELQFAADGSRIVYSSIRLGGEWTVYTANPDGGSPTPLTRGDQDNGRPSWFGAELSVVYEGMRPDSRRLWVAPIDGAPRPLDSKIDLGKADRLRVSPDAKKIAGHMQTAAGTQLVVEDRNSGTVNRITPPERNIGFPCWSRDGKWIAAGERINGVTHIVVVPAAGGQVRTVVEAPGQSFAHDWSPDGERISFAGLRDGVWNIYWVDIRTGRVQQLTHFDSKSAFVRYPAWSPKGDQIVFEHNDLVANIYTGELR